MEVTLLQFQLSSYDESLRADKNFDVYRVQRSGATTLFQSHPRQSFIFEPAILLGKTSTRERLAAADTFSYTLGDH